MFKIRIDSYRFLQHSLDNLVKILNEDDFKTFKKKEFPDNWELLNKKLAYPYEYFKNHSMIIVKIFLNITK